jgi:acyl-coenzyme A synthetase/AMP-(fatty) acid ligase
MTTFQDARAFLLKHRTDYDAAVKGFSWPDPVPFNWALDWFDAELARDTESKDRSALWIVDAGGNREIKISFAALSRRSNQVANLLRAQGLKRGDHLLLLLGNVVPLWETMLAAMKLGVVIIPATTLLTPDELRDRLDRGRYGQTETTLLVGNSPGQAVKVGSMGRPMPGYRVRIVDSDGNAATEGEVTLVLGADRPAGLMQGYQGDDGKLSGADGDLYRSGDVVFADDEGYLTFVGRSDDVFKSSDYRISPFELESILLEHEKVAEAAVVPSPDPIRLAIPKAYVLLVSGAERSAETALSIFRHLHTRLAPFKRIRRIELVSELPKTISGKIRRVQLRRLEHENDRGDPLRGEEFREEDFPELQKVRTAGSVEN